MSFKPITRLAGERLQPARPSLRMCRRDSGSFMAEGVGFEPTELSLNGFQDRRLKPLGHPSDNFKQTNTLPWPLPSKEGDSEGGQSYI